MRGLKTGLLTMSLAAALGAASLPAAAQGWGVSDKPSVVDGGKPMCMVWHGTTPPAMNMTVMTDRRFISARASQFTSLADNTPISLTFPTGNTYTMNMRKLSEDSIAIFFSQSAFEQASSEMKTPGTFTLTAGDTNASFPVGNLTGAFEYLDRCVAMFPEPPPAEE